jgi:hypothetical protein
MSSAFRWARSPRCTSEWHTQTARSRSPSQGGGYGSHPAQYRQFQADSKKNADVLLSQGMKHFVATYGHGPQRVQLEAKDPRGFAEYVRQFEEHSRSARRIRCSGCRTGGRRSTT